LITRNAVADAATIADKPSAAANVCTTVPALTPSADAIPTRRPWPMLRPRMYSVSWPGVMLSSTADSTNSQ
jgi:hypothetical protein